MIDDPVFGPTSLVLDTTTNLEWLRIDFTGNGGPSSPGPLAIVAQLGPGQKFAGFQVAGTDNWAGLMDEFGFPTKPGPPDCFGDTPCNIDPAAEANFTSLFGIPVGVGIDYNQSPGPGPLFDAVFFLPDGVMIYSGFGEGHGPDVSLVRGASAVPEPGSLGLMLAGLLALIGIAWRKERT